MRQLEADAAHSVELAPEVEIAGECVHLFLDRRELLREQLDLGDELAYMQGFDPRGFRRASRELAAPEPLRRSIERVAHADILP